MAHDPSRRLVLPRRSTPIVTSSVPPLLLLVLSVTCPNHVGAATDTAHPIAHATKRPNAPPPEHVADVNHAYPTVCHPNEVCVDASVAADGCKTCTPPVPPGEAATVDCLAEPEHRSGSVYVPQRYNPQTCPSCACVPLAAPSMRDSAVMALGHGSSAHADAAAPAGASPLDNDTRRPPLIVLGLTKSIVSIEPSVYVFLHRLSCADGGAVSSGLEDHWEVHLHLLVPAIKRERMADGLWHPNSEWIHKSSEGLRLCNTTVHHEGSLQPRVNLQGRSRIERIGLLRDAVRAAALKDVPHAATHNGGGVVVVLDLDLVDPPSTHAIAEAAARVSHTPALSSESDNDGEKDQDENDESITVTAPSSPGLDVVCANGKDVNPVRFWMYDTFATILPPNTFVFPTTARRHPHLASGEDGRFVIQTPVRNQDVYPLFTREDLTMMIDKGPPVFPVRSCFGGLAVYRAETYFHPTCQYSVNATDAAHFNPGERYSNKFTPGLGEEHAPCEHVMFHECLRHRHGLRAGIARDMRTLWSRRHRNDPPHKHDG
eukprot:m.88241 g.88241  ORF g.88241 m.88241 type:complete len:544 (-) comp9744_c0_seq1:88-1719(-)